MKRHNTSTSTSLPARGARALLALSALAAIAAACADPSPRDLGFTQTAQDLNNIPDTAFFSDVDEFVGKWVGSAQEPLALTADGSTPPYRFPSGSTRIELEVTRSATTGLTGHLVFGSGEPPAPPLDPDAGYPVGVGYDQLLGYSDDAQYAGFVATGVVLPPFEGFAYTVDLYLVVSQQDGAFQIGDGVAGFAFSSNEPLGSWCELQTPYAHPDSASYSCLPETGGSIEIGSDGSGRMCTLYGPNDTSTCLPDFSNIDECLVDGGPVTQVNCDKVAICISGFCACNDAGCLAAPTAERLSVRRVGDELVGLFEGSVFKNARGLNVPLGEVRLHQEQ